MSASTWSRARRGGLSAGRPEGEFEGRPFAVDVGRARADRTAVALDREPAEGETEAPAAETFERELLAALAVLPEERGEHIRGDHPAAVADPDEEARLCLPLGMDVDDALV